MVGWSLKNLPLAASTRDPAPIGWGCRRHRYGWLDVVGGVCVLRSFSLPWVGLSKHMFDETGEGGRRPAASLWPRTAETE